MKIKIVSDGTVRNTRVFDAETGMAIGEKAPDPGMTSIVFDMSWSENRLPSAKIDLIGVACEATCEGRLFTEIAGKQYELLETAAARGNS